MSTCHEGVRLCHRFLARAVYALLFVLLCSITTVNAFGQLPRIVTNIVYYDGPEFEPQHHVLDLYLPADRTDFPVLMFVYGGSWSFGDKSWYPLLGLRFAQAGFGVVIPNYRLTDGSPSQVVHPGHIHDVARAFAWTYDNIADYGGNVEQIFISGHSAGGHLVALLALDPQYLADHDLTPDAIRGVIAISGVHDVRSPSLARVFGDSPEARAQASPITHVGPKPAPPFQLLYGDDERTGLGAQAVRLYESLVEVPSEADIQEIADRNHITIILLIWTDGDETAQAIIRFINERT